MKARSRSQQRIPEPTHEKVEQEATSTQDSRSQVSNISEELNPKLMDIESPLQNIKSSQPQFINQGAQEWPGWTLDSGELPQPTKKPQNKSIIPEISLTKQTTGFTIEFKDQLPRMVYFYRSPHKAFYEYYRNSTDGLVYFFQRIFLRSDNSATQSYEIKEVPTFVPNKKWVDNKYFQRAFALKSQVAEKYIETLKTGCYYDDD